MTIASDRSIAVCGLPNSGKTTFLAALWHLIESSEVETQLKRGPYTAEYEYVNQLRRTWLSGREQDRTSRGQRRTVTLDLVDSNNEPHRLRFPDHSGESFGSMWQDRMCDRAVAADLQNCSGIALFIDAAEFTKPRSLSTINKVARRLQSKIGGSDFDEDSDRQTTDWTPDQCPDQVKLADLLLALSSPPLSVKARKIAILLSAWDRVDGRGLSPEEFLKSELPLLAQSLLHSEANWEYRVFGVSAQGGEYAPHQGDAPKSDQLTELLTLDNPAERIRLVSDGAETHDLTKAVGWLLG